jgi:transglutaminase-like putative cysteine protease
VPYQTLDFVQVNGPLRASAALRAFSEGLAIPADATLGELVLALGHTLHERFEYQKNVTRYDSTTDDFLRTGAGVCQDFTHLMLALLRLRRVPCRYVSGYLHVVPAGDEVAQSHAWVEVFSTTHGWVPFDPTHDREIDERYVVVGHGRSYDDVPPNRGIFRGNGRESLTAEVRTRVSTRADLPAVPEEIQTLDVPVYQEIPGRRREWATTLADEAAAQQQ